MIASQTGVPLPQLIDDEFLLVDGEGRQPAGMTSYLELFVASVKLFDVIGDVVATCYEQKQSPEDARVGSQWWRLYHLNDILKLDNTLNDFWAALPAHLRTSYESVGSSAGETNSVQWRQAKILQCRFAILPRNMTSAQLTAVPC